MDKYIDCVKKLMKNVYYKDTIEFQELQEAFGDYYQNYKKKDKKIIIFFNGGIGDAVIFTYCLSTLHFVYPDYQLDICVNSSLKTLFANVLYVNQIIVMDRCEFFQQNLPTLLNSIRFYSAFVYRYLLKNNYEKAFICGFDESDVIMAAYFAGVKNIHISYFSTEVHLKRYNYKGKFTINDNNLTCMLDDWIGTIQCSCNQKIECVKENIINIPENVKNNVLTYLNSNKYIYAIGIAGGRKCKHWNIDNYIQLLKIIIEHHEKNKLQQPLFVIFGGEAEQADASYIKEQIGVKYVYDNTKCGLLLTFAMMSACNMYIGHDTCAVHMASIYHLPCLVIQYESIKNFLLVLKSNSYCACTLYFPYNTLSMIILSKPFDDYSQDINTITVEEVYNALLQLKLLDRNNYITYFYYGGVYCTIDEYRNNSEKIFDKME